MLPLVGEWGACRRLVNLLKPVPRVPRFYHWRKSQERANPQACQLPQNLLSDHQREFGHNELRYNATSMKSDSSIRCCCMP